MNDQEIIKACPICGRPIEHHCWHSSNEVTSVLMTKKKAIKLMEAYLRGMKTEASVFESSLARLIKS